MSKTMNSVTALSFAAAVVAAALFHYFGVDLYLTLAITFGTTAYHLGMRLVVGLLYDTIMKNRADYTKKWYQIHPWEDKLYGLLRVKAWKGKMPSYHPETFSSKKHTWDEIAQAMCQSELVHETNVILSFVPLAASGFLGSFYVFLVTSVGGALFDLLFVIMQRYNRPRIIKIISRQKGTSAVSH